LLDADTSSHPLGACQYTLKEVFSAATVSGPPNHPWLGDDRVVAGRSDPLAQFESNHEEMAVLAPDG
jgi:hypothetical protein